MNNRTKNIWLGLALVVGILLLAACAPQPGPAEEEAETPAETETGAEEPAPAAGEVQEPISKDIHLDPATVSPEDEDSLLVNSYLYEGLVSTEADVPVPALATAWPVSEDGLSYTFKLRPDAVFHDGTPLDADAVIANFNRWFDPEDPLHGSASYDEWESIFLGFKGETQSDGTPKSVFDGIEKVDNLTVLIHLSRLEPDLILNLSLPAFSIASPDALAAEGDAYGTQGGSVAGSGPYMVGEWTDERLVLVPNPDYWGEVPEGALEFPLQ